MARTSAPSRGGERFDDRPALVPVFVTALAAAALSAALLVVGALLPVVEGAERGFAGAPVAVALAVLPVVVAGGLAARDRIGVAAGVLAGVAALAPGRAVLDLQFASDPSRALRPELYMPGDLHAHAPAAGLWVLVAGHAVAVVAGLVALRVRRGAAAGEPVFGDSADARVQDARARTEAGEREGVARGGSDRSMRRPALVAGLAVVAAVGLLMQPFASENVYLLAQNAFEGPVVAMAGYLLIAAAVPLVAVIAASSDEPEIAAGAVCGLVLGGLSVAVPALVSGFAVDSVGVDTGPFVAIVGLLGLAGLAVAGARTTSDSAGSDEPTPDDDGVHLPGRGRLLVSTGGLAVLTGVFAVVGALTPQLDTPGSIPPPDSPARWTLLAAGVVVGVLGLAMSAPRIAVRIRPVLSVAWVSVLVAGTAVLDTALTATGSASGFASAGPGVVWTWAAMVLAAVTAVCSVIAGVVERDAQEDSALEDGALEGGVLEPSALEGRTVEDGESGEGSAGRPSPMVLGSLVLTGVLAVLAFGLPVLTAPGYAAAGLWTGFGTPSWGLLAGVLVVLGALALVPRSRPSAAVGVLAGAGVVLAVHAAAFPLTRGALDGASAAAGFWFAFVAVVAVLVTGTITALTGPAPRNGVR